MSKKYLVIFILFLAVAVTAGYTLATINNNKNISQQTLEKNITLAAEPAKAVAVDLTPVVIGNGESLVMSQIEQEEISLMLNKVGISADKEYSQRINEFQQKNTITPTGILDSRTLGALVNQVKIQQVNQRLEH